MALSDTDADPKNVTVEDYADDEIRLATHLVGPMNSPDIVTGEVSSTGKTIRAPHPHDEDTSFRLDTATILAGESEYRDSRAFSLYTYDTFQRTQKANLAPGPQAGAHEVSDAEDLPDPTHEVVGDESDETDESEENSDDADADAQSVAEGDRVCARGEADDGDMLDARGTVKAVTDSKAVVSLDDGRTFMHRGDVLIERTDDSETLALYRDATLDRLGANDETDAETAPRERGDADFEANEYVAVRSTAGGERHTVLGYVAESSDEQTTVRLEETGEKAIIDADGRGLNRDGTGLLASDATIQPLEGGNRHRAGDDDYLRANPDNSIQ